MHLAGKRFFVRTCYPAPFESSTIKLFILQGIFSMLPCLVLRRLALAINPAWLRHRSVPLIISRNTMLTQSLYFQSRTHSSQFARHDISSVFLGLRTCQKHPEVGRVTLTKLLNLLLTQVISKRYAKNSSDSCAERPRVGVYL